MPNNTLEAINSTGTRSFRIRIFDRKDGTFSYAPGIEFDTTLITYTNDTKTVISKVEWLLNGVVARTLTPTFGATTDTWVET